MFLAIVQVRRARLTRNVQAKNGENVTPILCACVRNLTRNVVRSIFLALVFKLINVFIHQSPCILPLYVVRYSTKIQFIMSAFHILNTISGQIFYGKEGYILYELHYSTTQHANLTCSDFARDSKSDVGICFPAIQMFQAFIKTRLGIFTFGVGSYAAILLSIFFFNNV